ncbi:MAG: TonB-dependent receptor [Methylophilaceae bacterium]|nr:TonB-dependent receptor [Methylophilaceae bacterium]
MKPIIKRLSLIGFLLTNPLSNAAFAADALKLSLDNVIVSADFRASKAAESPVSLTEIDQETIEARGAQHLEELLNLAPNVNASSGASRSRFFQIRGMGIRSQYNSPINPSVGLIIDGIDFSRIGGAATLFDIDSVEVLRGPQGTKFGPNAIAGVINMRSAEPTKELEMRAQTGLGEYNTRNFGAVVSGTIVENQLLGRASLYSHQSDGYMRNSTLNRDDTQQQDELTFRSKFKLFATEDLTFDFTFMHLDINNGYDAFTLNNSRNSKADEPGVDNQNTNAFGVKANWQLSDAVIVQSEMTYLNSASMYSFDGDWSQGLTLGWRGGEKYKRDRDNYSFEVRALSDNAGRIFNGSTDWVIGAYHFNQDEKFNSFVDYGYGLTQVDGDYTTKNTAVFGQLDSHLTDKLTFVTGGRIEYFEAQYKDAGIVRAAASSLKTSVNEVLYGAKLGLNYQANKDQLIYTSLTRGYKPGGINDDNRIAANAREFNTEFMLNLETGLKSAWLDGRLMTNLAAFYAKRKDAQTKSSTQAAGGPSFIEFTANAAEATHMGIEASLDWFLTDQFRVIGSLGLLDTKFDDYTNPDPNAFSPKGRDVANAPSYQFNLGTEWFATPQWTFRANVEGKDAFYFSDSHDFKSTAYALVNTSIDYTVKHWKTTFWVRNLFDKDYATRGFYFDQGFGTQGYQQFGDPRVGGVTVTYDY